MPSSSPEWAVPAPVQALLWWPPLAFLLALLVPGSADGVIALSGLFLALVGVVGGALRQRARPRRPETGGDDAPVPLRLPAGRRAA